MSQIGGVAKKSISLQILFTGNMQKPPYLEKSCRH